MSDRIGLVLGATGITGNALVRHLSISGWTVLAASRRAVQPAKENVIPLSIDLTDKAAIYDALLSYHITHVFFAAYSTPFNSSISLDFRTVRRMVKTLGFATPVIDRFPPLASMFYTELARRGLAYDPEQTNLKMLRNVVEVTLARPHDLTHVALVTGGKMYGMHLTPHIYKQWTQPFREHDARPPGPNFYFEQEDYLHDVFARSGVTWSVVRPSYLIGDNPNAAFNVLIGLAVYASVLKAGGYPLIFPGDEQAANCLLEMSDADLVAELMEWSSVTPSAHNQAFNAVNGKSLSWSEIWPSIAEFFGMKDDMNPQNFSARTVIRESDNLWNELVKIHQLEDIPLSKLVDESFFEVLLMPDWNTEYSMDKARRFGFTREVDTAEMFRRHFQRLRDRRIIPPA
ncbi:MAG: NAD-dependent epimerase/dehydratase family protein [Anaerolineae bacterium]